MYLNVLEDDYNEKNDNNFKKLLTQKTFKIKAKIKAVANYCNSRFCYQLAFFGSFTRDIILPQARISKISGIHLTA